MSRFDEAMTNLCDVLRSKTGITRKISFTEIPTIINVLSEQQDTSTDSGNSDVAEKAIAFDIIMGVVE